MRGIQFQQGCDEEEDYPLIIEIGDIGLIILKPAAQESIHRIYHEMPESTKKMSATYCMRFRRWITSEGPS